MNNPTLGWFYLSPQNLFARSGIVYYVCANVIHFSRVYWGTVSSKRVKNRLSILVSELK